MRLDPVLAPEVGQADGPDLTRHLLVCVLAIGALLGLAWVFRRFVAGHVRARAARRSLQVLDVLPLAGKQKLVLVRCQGRSFLLGIGEKEIATIAELEPDVPAAAGEGRAFSTALEEELELRPAAPARGVPAGGVLA